MKFELRQVIYYMMDNRVHSAPILSRHCVENATEYTKIGMSDLSEFAPWGEEGVWYKTIHSIVHEDKAYASKEELLADL